MKNKTTTFAEHDESAGLALPNDAVPLEKVKRILMVKFRHLGDVLLMSASLSALKKSMPNAEIDVLIYSDTVSMLENHPAIRKIHTADREWKNFSFVDRLKNEWKCLKNLRKENYDLVFNLTEGDRGALASLISGANWRVGLDDPRNMQSVWKKFAYTHKFRTDYNRRHMVEQNLDALRRIGIRVPINSEPLLFKIDKKDEFKIQEEVANTTGLALPNDAVPLEKVKRILMVKFRHLGDVLLMSASLSALKKSMPNAEIDVLIYSDTVSMLENHPAIRKIHTADREWKNFSFVDRLKNEWKCLKNLRKENYDLVFNLTEGDRGALASLISGANWRVGLDDPRNMQSVWKKFAYTHKFRTDYNRRHMVEQNLDALRRIGIRVPINSEPLLFKIDKKDDDSSEEKLRSLDWDGEDFVVIHPTSRWMFKCLPPKKVAYLADYFYKKGLRVILTSSSEKSEKSMILEVKQYIKNPLFDLSGELTIKELGSLIAKAKIFSGTDSVPMHMAAALGTPTLAWFGPSFEKVWHPWMVRQCLVSLDVSCRPCGFDGCGGGKRSECLIGINSKELSEAADRLLNDFTS